MAEFTDAVLVIVRQSPRGVPSALVAQTDFMTKPTFVLAALVCCCTESATISSTCVFVGPKVIVGIDIGACTSGLGTDGSGTVIAVITVGAGTGVATGSGAGTYIGMLTGTATGSEIAGAVGTATGAGVTSLTGAGVGTAMGSVIGIATGTAIGIPTGAAAIGAATGATMGDVTAPAPAPPVLPPIGIHTPVLPLLAELRSLLTQPVTATPEHEDTSKFGPQDAHEPLQKL